MTKNILIAQIGKGAYRTVNYARFFVQEDFSKKEKIEYVPGESYETGYTFEAVFHEIETEGEKVDTIFLVGTKTSYWGTLCLYYAKSINSEMTVDKLGEIIPKVVKNFVKEDVNYKIEEIGVIKNIREQVEQYLEECFYQKFKRIIEIKIVILEPGIEVSQLRKNFIILQQNMGQILENQENKIDFTTNIYFDISNGFRSLPMYIFTFVNYLTRIYNRKFELFMYYGMADAITEYENNKYAPLVDLKEVNELMLWINAVNEFRNYGSVKQIEQILAKHNEWDIIIDSEKELLLSKVFRMFEYGTNANNLKILEETIEIISNLTFSEEQKEALPEQARILLLDIAQDFRERFIKEDIKYKYAYLTLKLAEWFFEQGRIGNAAVAFIEGTVTYIIERFPDVLSQWNQEKGKSDLDEEEKKSFVFTYENREKIRKIINKSYESSFRKRYERVYEYVRNISAHILYKDLSVEEMDICEEDIKELIQELLKDMEESDNTKSILSSIVESSEQALREKQLKKAITNLKNNKKVKNLPDNMVISLEILRKEIQIMKEYEERGKESYSEFKEKYSGMKILPQLVQNWLKEPIDDENLKKKLYEKNKDKSCSDRILNYYITNSKLLWQIIRTEK